MKKIFSRFNRWIISLLPEFLQKRLWIFYLLITVLSYLLINLLLRSFEGWFEREKPEMTFWIVVYGLAIYAANLVVPLLFLIITIRSAWSAFRLFRNSKGHYTKNELVAKNQRDFEDRCWQDASRLRQEINAGVFPQPIQFWDLNLNANETAVWATDAFYSRYYGTDVSYTVRSGGFFYGHPAFVIGGALASSVINGVSNANSRKQAELQAAAQWRETCSVPVVVTNQRVLCLTPQRGWLSFWYSDTVAIYPDAGSKNIVMQFGSTEPLMLHGAAGPIIAVLVTLMIHGRQAVREHPALQALDSITWQPISE